ncbi:transporter [Xanthomonas albilineans]|uniref:Hypothetical secreted protein n=1 Tax=Xanthomonas albilineans (strain GPE PC73 / CFBP 7063) TaxID=380358 RepID=D2UGK7_XANAP|nr:transporter [Xanthomonas albilineans]QHQ29776.1 putative secreted protein [Xanthomonas albilineans]CBA17518.1 hypothetical secreted protein [Xanthomonas albilineans GPE PC73]
MNRSRMRFPLPSRIRQRLSVLALLSIVHAAPAAAQSVPQSVTLPTGLDTGGTSFFDGFTSTKPGWAAIQYLRRYDFDAIKDAHGDDVPVFRDPHIGSSVWITQVVYVSGYKMFGGALGFNALAALVDLDASFARNSPMALRANGVGLGDLTIGPYLQMDPVIHDGRPVFSQRFELDALVPIGKFDQHRDINQGSGYWSVLPNWAFSILPTPRWEISGRLNYIYNFRADKASNVPQFGGFVFHNGQAGDAVWLNFASSLELVKDLHIGINGYYLKQLRDNRTNDLRVADSKQTQFYLGPGLSWRIDQHNIFNANFYMPVEVKNAPSGDNVNFQYVHVF